MVKFLRPGKALINAGPRKFWVILTGCRWCIHTDIDREKLYTIKEVDISDF
jgi:hypothetical protein